MKRRVIFGKVLVLGLVLVLLAISSCIKNDQPVSTEPIKVAFVPQGVIPDMNSIRRPSNAKVIFSWSAGGGNIYNETSRNTGSDIVAYPGSAKPIQVTTPGGQAMLIRAVTGKDSNFGMPKNIEVPAGYRLEVIACYATQPNGRGPSFRLGADWRTCDNCQSTSFKGSTHLDVFGDSLRSQNGDWRVLKLSESPNLYSGKPDEWWRVYNSGPSITSPPNHRWVVGWCQFLGQQYPGVNDIWEGGDAYLAWMIVWYEPVN